MQRWWHIESHFHETRSEEWERGIWSTCSLYYFSFPVNVKPATRNKQNALAKTALLWEACACVCVSVGVQWKMEANIVRGVIVLICRQQVDCECSKGERRYPARYNIAYGKQVIRLHNYLFFVCVNFVFVNKTITHSLVGTKKEPLLINMEWYFSLFIK